ncbi:Ig-like domain-containing protein, partial [Desulfoluna spongiiphila]
AGGTFAVDVAGSDLAAGTKFTATVTGTDEAGNPFTQSAEATYTVDTDASATIAVNPITNDDVINAVEMGSTIEVTGTVGGDAAEGDEVTFTVNGKDYQGTVNTDGTFTVDVAGSDLAADTDFTVTVTGSDDAGNPFTASTESTHTVDTTASAPSMETTDVTGNEDTEIPLDISAALTDTDGSETLSAITIGDVPDGAILSAGTNNGDGTWTLTQDQLDGLTIKPPADSDVDFDLTVTATATEIGGDTATVTESLHVTVTPVADVPVIDFQVSSDNVVSDGLVGHWVFEENGTPGGTTHDLVNDQEGTLTGGAHSAGSDHNNGALVLDGDGDYVDVSGDYTEPLSGTATLSVWVKLPDGYTGGDGTNTIGWNSPSIIGSEKHGGTDDIQWGWIDDDGQINMGVGDSTGAGSTTAVNDGEWHHVVMTRDHETGETKMYVDGILEDTRVTEPGIRDGMDLSGFGATFGSDGTHTYLEGQLDDIRVYDRVLTDEEISQIHTYESNQSSFDLVGMEGDPVSITLGAQPTDTDGSESITSIVLSGIPTGAILSDGTHTFTATDDLHEMNVTDWDLSNLTITAYANAGGFGESYTLTATATSTEGDGGASASTSSSLEIYVMDSAPVAVDDTDSVGFRGTATGNVILGEGGEDMGADEVDADDVTLSSISFDGTTYTFAEDGSLMNGSDIVTNNTIVGDHGTLQIHQDGSYTYTSSEHWHPHWWNLEDSFDYTITDSDGDSSTASVTIRHDNLSTVADSAVAHEAGLPEGTEATTDSETVTGNLLDNDMGVDGDAFISSITSGAHSDTEASGGQLSIQTDHGTITVYTESDGLHRAGDYEYTLEHPSQGDDVVDTISYTISDSDGEQLTGSLAVNIQDDAPTGETVTADIHEDAADVKTTNLIIVLDRSGSMAFDMDGNRENSPDFDPNNVRMDIAKDALAAMFDSYDNLGNVNIQFVRFENSAVKSDWFMDDKTGANTYLNDIHAWGGTDYDGALDTVRHDFDPPEADSTLLYFISDGEPNRGDECDQTEWENFLQGEGSSIDTVFGIGITEDSTLEALNPIAWPNPADPNDPDPHVVQVHNAFDLKQTLLETVSEGIVKGDATLLTTEGNDGIHLGADGGHLQSILVDGQLHTYDPSGSPTESITTARGGIIDINFETGEYFYTINPHDTVSGEQEVFVLTAVDGDGDTTSVDLIINLDYVAAIDANHDTIITNAALGDDLAIDFSALLANDSGANSIDDGSIHAEGSTQLTQSSDQVTLHDLSDGDAFTYDISSGDVSDTAKVEVVVEDNANLYGTIGDDILVNTRSNSGTFSIQADVERGWTGDSSNQMGIQFTSNTSLSILAVTIDLSAGGDLNAVFDPSDYYDFDSYGPFIGDETRGISSSDVNFSFSDDHSKMTITFEPGTFTSQDEFRFGIDTDFLSHNINDKGNAFGKQDVGITVSLSDGTEVSGTYDHQGNTSHLTIDGTTDNAPVHLYGNEGDDVLSGNDADEILDGGQGHDTIYGGGGDDTIVFDTQDTLIDGGEGTDTLKISQDVLDFSTLTKDSVTNIEALDLTSDNAQTVSLTLENVLDMTGPENVLHVSGGDGDQVTVDLSNSGDGWTHDGNGLFSNTDGTQVQIVSVDDADKHIPIFTDDGTAI